MIDVSMLERLLYEEESVVLDFKQAQYLFDGATKDQQAKILKDVLAYANAWRRADAYILIGVEDVKGGKGIVHGVSKHLDDAKLQQFVNSKTQRPVAFSYYAVRLEGKPVGVIHILVQPRPIFLAKDFDGLKKNVVYIRRSSSTDEADPDEVALMGQESGATALLEPVIGIAFGDARTRAILGPDIGVSTSNLMLPPADTIPDYPLAAGIAPGFVSASALFKNRDYYRELAQYKAAARAVRPIWFTATNTSAVVGTDVRLEIQIPDRPETLTLLDEYAFPQKPSADIALTAGHFTAINADVEVKPVPGGWFVEARFGKIQPKATVWTQYPLYAGAHRSRHIEFTARIFADNLAVPISVPMSIKVQVTKVVLTLENLLAEP